MYLLCDEARFPYLTSYFYRQIAPSVAPCTVI